MGFVAATVQVGMIGLFLPVMIYLQSVLGLGALEAGLVMAPAMALSALLSPFAGRTADRIDGRYVLMTGLSLFAAGMAWLTWTIDVGRQWWEFQPALAVVGIGIGCVFGPMVTVAMRNVGPATAGAASGVLNTIRQVGTVVGSAVIGAVLQNRLAVSLRDEAVRRAADLPASVRSGLLSGLDGGLEIKPPPGTPPELAEHVRRVAAETFAHGFVHAVRPTLALPVVVIVIGAAACLLVRRRRPGSTYAATRAVSRTGRGGVSKR